MGLNMSTVKCPAEVEPIIHLYSPNRRVYLQESLPLLHLSIDACGKMTGFFLDYDVFFIASKEKIHPRQIGSSQWPSDWNFSAFPAFWEPDDKRTPDDFFVMRCYFICYKIRPSIFLTCGNTKLSFILRPI